MGNKIRKVKREKPVWLTFPERCPHCGAMAEISTRLAKEGLFEDGNLARCPQCKLTGVLVSEPTEDEIRWHNRSALCTCKWCQKHLVRKPNPHALDAFS